MTDPFKGTPPDNSALENFEIEYNGKTIKVYLVSFEGNMEPTVGDVYGEMRRRQLSQPVPDFTRLIRPTIEAMVGLGDPAIVVFDREGITWFGFPLPDNEQDVDINHPTFRWRSGTRFVGLQVVK